MKQGINLGYVCHRRNSEEKRELADALILCREAGFSELDYLSSVQTDDYRETAHFCREAMERAGVKVHQSHCPFPVSGKRDFAVPGICPARSGSRVDSRRGISGDPCG